MSKKFELTSKEGFINEMITDSIKNKEGFEVGFISNGEITFNDLTGFILLKGLSTEFKEYYSNKKKTEEDKFIKFNDVFMKEIIEEELPFADIKYIKSQENLNE